MEFNGISKTRSLWYHIVQQGPGDESEEEEEENEEEEEEEQAEEKKRVGLAILLIFCQLAFPYHPALRQRLLASSTPHQI